MRVKKVSVHCIGFVLRALLVCGLALYQSSTVAQAQAQAVTPPAIGDIAPEFELKDWQDKEVNLSKFTEKGPVVLVMLRGYPGYQCPFCTEQVGKMLLRAEDFKKAKASVILVYPGPSEKLNEHAAEFVRDQEIPANFHLALDPEFTFTNRYGLRWEGEGETSYPATFVLDQGRKVLFAKVSKEHGDRADVNEVLKALPE